MKTAPACGIIYLSIYVCIIYPHVCHTLVPEICVCSEMLRVLRYIDVCDLQLHTLN